MKFIYQNTTKLFFTNELCDDLNSFIASNNFHKALIISGGEATTKIANSIISRINVEHTLCSGVQSNPLSELAESIAQQAKHIQPDFIITIGGGSVHDTGKAVAVLYYDNGNNAEAYTVNGSLSVPGIKKTLPVITIPTVYGSGAEVSPAALIRIGNEKRVIFSTLLHPLACFIDTKLTRGLTKAEFARSAFDSYIQALEGMLSTSANNISDAFARISIEYFNDCLPSLQLGDFSEDILEKLAIASAFSSYVCSTASVGAIHAISDPISGRFNVHHGTALAMVAVDVLKKNVYTQAEEKIKSIDDMLSNAISEHENVYEKLIDKTFKIITSLELLKNVKKQHVASEVIACMVKESFNGDMVGNPYEFSDNEIETIIENWYED